MGNIGEHHRTVDRVAAILETVAYAGEGLTLTQLAARLDAPVSSVQKLAAGLVAVGYLDQHDRRYGLGAGPVMLGRRAGLASVGGITDEDMSRLHAATGAPVLLAIKLGSDAVYLHWVGADEPFEYALGRRLRRPLHETAAGRVLLAHIPPARRPLVVEQLGLGERDGAELLRRLSQIRECGRELGPSGPLIPEASAVAVPVWEGGRVVAALSATDHHATAEPRMSELARSLEDTVARAAAGGSGRPA